MIMRIICIGHAAYDITIPVEEFPIENSKNRVTQRIECGGGPASNAAYLLAKWNIETYFAGVIGNDVYGKRILKEFNDIGVKTNYLEINDEVTTTSSFILANSSNGSRTILTYRPNKMKMNNINLDFKPDVILVDGQEVEISKKIIEENPDAISIIDAGRAKEDIIELTKIVDYVVCSKDFACTVTGLDIDYNNTSSLVNVFAKLKETFKKNIIVTLEDQGCMYEVNGDVKKMPSLHVKALDSTGAGDIFHGAFTYGIASGFDIEKSIMYSNIAGAISVTRVGGRYSIPTLEEVKQYYDALK